MFNIEMVSPLPIISITPKSEIPEFRFQISDFGLRSRGRRSAIGGRRSWLVSWKLVEKPREFDRKVKESRLKSQGGLIHEPMKFDRKVKESRLKSQGYLTEKSRKVDWKVKGDWSASHGKLIEKSRKFDRTVNDIWPKSKGK